MPTIPVTWLDEQTANATTADSQSDPEIVQLANGNILVLWTSSNNTGVGSPASNDIIGQIFSPAGQPVGAEFRLNVFGNAENEFNGSVAALPNGGFVVVYERLTVGSGENQLCLDTYDASGARISGAFVQADASTLVPNYSQITVAASSNTSVMIAYTETNGGTSSVVYRLFDPSTNTVGAQVPLLSGGASDPDIAVLTNGNYVIAGAYGGADAYIAYRIIGPTGTSILSNTTVPTTNSNTFTDQNPSVAALAGGGFVIGFESSNGGDGDFRVHTFNAAGTQTNTSYVGSPFISTVTSYNEGSVVGLADGTFVVVYDNDTDDRLDISRFDAAGNYVATFNTAAGANTSISATALADGRFAAAWTSLVTGEISFEIFDTRDAPNTTPVNTTSLLVGTIGNDTFNPAAGNSVVAGAGDDLVFAALGADNHDGGTGIDTLNTTSFNGVYNVDLTTGLTNFGGELFLNFENLVFGNGGGTIVGTTGNNVITGGTGNDTIYASTIGDFTSGGVDTINSGDGNDTVYSSGNGTFNLGNGNDSFFAGLTGVGPETADGGAGVDSWDGSSFGGDYNFNLATGATNFGESYINFENATMGDGNDQLFGTTGDNILSGGDGNDILAGLGGNDTLIGGAGGNQFIGSTGNDIFIVTAGTTGQMVLNSLIESSGEGTDEVRTTASVFALDWFGGNEIELLTATDNGTHAALIGNAFGNTITGGTGTDDLFGRDGDDRLIGGSGSANSMYGGLGGDTYVVTAVGDSVIEFAGQGSDTVEAGVTAFTLGANVENLTFTGGNTDRIGVGNTQSNLIRGLGGADSLNGDGGDDVIIGGSGADILQGGAGADQFRYEGGESGMDRILDFVSGTDDIALRSAFFTPTATVSFVSGAGAVANTSNSTIIYDTNSSIVYYDDDGNGAGAAVAIAQLNAGQSFTASDFLFY
jgi:Ca2+-binding RTX toxin-like protein